MKTNNEYTGKTVIMSDELKKSLIENDCKEHVVEFGNCVGVVEDWYDETEQELNVRWQPSMLRYGYKPDELKFVDIKKL